MSRRARMKPESRPTVARRFALFAAIAALMAGVFSPRTHATPVNSLGPVNLWIGLTNSVEPSTLTCA